MSQHQYTALHLMPPLVREGDYQPSSIKIHLAMQSSFLICVYSIGSLIAMTSIYFYTHGNDESINIS